MFSAILKEWIPSILRAAVSDKPFEEAWKEVPFEVMRGLNTTLEGKVGPYFEYLDKLIKK